MKDLKYSYEALQKFCGENGIELCKDYSKEIVNQKTKIEGKCSTSGCNELFNKGFEAFLKNSLCPNCAKIQKYLNVKNTFLKNYGVSHPSKLEIIKNKNKATNLEKYGVEYTFQSQIIKDKIKTTNIQRFGVENPTQNKEIKNKAKQTSLTKYGFEYPTQNDEVKTKFKNTCLQKYGVEYPSQNDEVKTKFKNTCLQKYGVENPTQNPEIAEKASNNSFQTSSYTLPSGNIIKYQGYENFALDELLKTIDEINIINSKKDVPVIWYNDIVGKKRRHYVDIFIPTENMCIEVKSEWYFNQSKDIILLKQEAGKKMGYNYEIWVYNTKKEKINCYE
jgi:hypothetical protein